MHVEVLDWTTPWVYLLGLFKGQWLVIGSGLGVLSCGQLSSGVLRLCLTLCGSLLTHLHPPTPSPSGHWVLNPGLHTCKASALSLSYIPVTASSVLECC